MMYLVKRRHTHNAYMQFCDMITQKQNQQRDAVR